MMEMIEGLKREDRGAGEVGALGGSEVGTEAVAGGTEAGGEGDGEEVEVGRTEVDQVRTPTTKMTMETFKWKGKDGGFL